MAATPVECAAEPEVLILTHTDDEAVIDVVLGRNGVIDGFQPDAVVVDCSAVSPSTARRDQEAMRAAGAGFIDGSAAPKPGDLVRGRR